LRERQRTANNIPVALLGVEADSKATDVADRVGRATRAADGREAEEDGRLTRGVVEDAGLGELGDRRVELEGAVGGGTPGMDDALRDALVVERGD